MNTPQLKTLIILLKTHQHVFHHVKKSIADSGLRTNEFTAMEALFAKGRMTTQQLAESVLIPNSSLTYVLDCLERKGLVRREKNKDDARVLELTLTPEGRNSFDRVYQKHYAQLRPIFDVLDPAQEAELQSLLKTLGKFAEQELKQ